MVDMRDAEPSGPADTGDDVLLLRLGRLPDVVVTALDADMTAAEPLDAETMQGYAIGRPVRITEPAGSADPAGSPLGMASG